MFDYFWLWSEMIVRWVHVIAGVAWIGSSFYFIALDLSLKPGKELPKEANGQPLIFHKLLFQPFEQNFYEPSLIMHQLVQH